MPGPILQRYDDERTGVRINFLLPFILPEGGLPPSIFAAFDTVEHLRGRGHDATLTLPRPEQPEVWLARDYVVAVDEPGQVPDAEVVVATTAESVQHIAELPVSKGKKYHCVHAFESLWRGNVDWAYRLPPRKLASCDWLARVMLESFNQPSRTVHLAVDHEVFRPLPENRRTGRRVLVMDHGIRLIGGTWIAAEAVARARRRLPYIELIVFGPNDRSRSDFGRVEESHGDLRGKELAQLLASCDVFLYPAIAEGFAIEPLQAMACGTAVITTDHAGTGDWAAPDVCYVTPLHNVEVTAQALVEALSDDERRARVAEAGRNKALEFTWDRALDELEAAFTATRW